MTQMIKSATSGYGGFAMTAAVYMLIQGSTEFAGWLTGLGKEGFANMGTYDLLLFVAKTSASMLIVLRALMNGSYGEAKNTSN